MCIKDFIKGPAMFKLLCQVITSAVKILWLWQSARIEFIFWNPHGRNNLDLILRVVSILFIVPIAVNDTATFYFPINFFSHFCPGVKMVYILGMFYIFHKYLFWCDVSWILNPLRNEQVRTAFLFSAALYLYDVINIW